MSNDHKWPIVYSKPYNVHLFGLEKFHPFDTSKWDKVFKHLENLIHIDYNDIFGPEEASEEELLSAHPQNYLSSLRWSWNVAWIAEIPMLACVPNVLCQRCYLRPMRFQTRGSMLAGELALERGWAINIGGGFHHCSRLKGQGFCPYADITLLVSSLFEKGKVRKVMIVDLDAHQGNGHERDFLQESRVFIMDVYNGSIYPADEKAKKAIRCKVELQSWTEDAMYPGVVENGLDRSLDVFDPDLMVYNAGTDVLEGDDLGRLSVSTLGVIKRDELVFRKALECYCHAH